ncbi:TetR/AcrR family transcriptional regulator [Paenibacillus sp. JDR-2]|uniref:TetR/AcrR family transcriptional regulator n=1 Tax=Paenibacillus sp. (strain JDR-2) TaxID=324057 RepID=UPI0001664AD8|nr:TetR/AcrR family transcriptional regulator [Paenibacillus sp. JDR-2]ACT03873.1 transcriptional regulator, TetR family [Paenibacillus sp. JDR-2]
MKARGRSTMNKQSLRDVKREATANALAEAAFDLAMERGMDSFVVEDVVQRAGYSRRTFANHFSCKEEAVVMGASAFNNVDEVQQLIENLTENSTPLEVMEHLVRMELTAGLFKKTRELVKLSKQHPTLEPYILSALHSHQGLAEQLLLDLFEDNYAKGYIQLLVGASYGAALPMLYGNSNIRFPGQSSEESPDSIPLDQYLDNMFGYLKNGF